MENYLNLMLGLPEVTVAKVLTGEDEVYLNIKLTNLGTNCPKCQGYTPEIHQNRPMIVRDLSCFNKFTYLLLLRRQLYCRCCQKYFTENLSWIDWKRRHTLRYEINIFERVISSIIAKVASTESLSYDEIEGIFNQIAKKQEDQHWLEASRISIDEIAMHKGHQDYKAVICDLDKKKLIEVIDGRTQDCLIERLYDLPIKVREAVKEVSVDMWHGFPKVIKEIFSKAQIVTERFHVMKLLIEELKKNLIRAGLKNRINFLLF